MTVSRVLLASVFLAMLPAFSFADEKGDLQVGPRALSRAFRVAARKASPSVVTILTYGQPTPPPANSDDPTQQPARPEPEDPTKKLTGIGSGVIVSSEGRVITNNHVIRGAKRVVVQLADDREYEAKNIKGDSESDVAVLEINREEPFDAIVVGDSNVIEIGDWVLAIGSPFRLDLTVSAGIISAKDRQIPRVPRSRLLQTDAAINPGNSGGALVDLDGSLIGINTAIATRSNGYQGIGFAIPVNQANWIAEELAVHGSVRRAAIGVTMAELNPKIARRVNLEPWLGVLAYQIVKGSVAEQAGLQQMDVIMEFAGQKVRDPGGLRAVIEQLPIGKKQDVRILRKGEEMTLQIELAPYDDPTAGSEMDKEEKDNDKDEKGEDKEEPKPEKETSDEDDSEPEAAKDNDQQDDEKAEPEVAGDK